MTERKIKEDRLKDPESRIGWALSRLNFLVGLFYVLKKPKENNKVTSKDALNPSQEKPQNGLKGLRHWRYDLMAGLQVALVSLPLSLGIAIASGAPPVTGLISSIIAGLIFPFLGGAYVTISGPAAGLAPVLMAGMITLGNGDLAVGYPLLLVAICLVGLVQIGLSLFNAGRYAIFLPVAVVEGMLAAIGLMIIIKQVPALLGSLAAPSKTILAAVFATPNHFRNLNPEVLMVGGISLLMVFVLPQIKNRFIARLPAPLVAVGVGILLGSLFHLDPHYLIKIPDNVIEHGIVLPDFSGVLQRPDLWFDIVLIVVTLTLIDGIESLATIAAVDKIDPYRRKSHPNQTLRSMGISNMLSSFVGGLTIIPGGLKSTANVHAGGRTLWANFYNAVFLISFLWVGKSLINKIPMTTLAAILIYVGWQLCAPRVFQKILAIGKEQLLIAGITLVAVLATDLLVGIFVGMLVEFLLLLYLLTPPFRNVLTGQLSPPQFFRLIGANLTGLFQNPVIKVISENGVSSGAYKIYLSSITSTNLIKLENVLGAIPPDRDVSLILTQSGRLVDHSSMEYLHHFQEQCLHQGREYKIIGMENFYSFSDHPLSARMHDVKLNRERVSLSLRQQHLSDIAVRYQLQFSPETIRSVNEHRFVYLGRGSQKEETNAMWGAHLHAKFRFFDHSFIEVPLDQTEERHTIFMIEFSQTSLQIPTFIMEPEHFLDRYAVGYKDILFLEYAVFSERYHVRGEAVSAIQSFFTKEWIALFESNPSYYLETCGNRLIAFRVNKELEDPNTIHELLDFAKKIIAVCETPGEQQSRISH